MPTIIRQRKAALVVAAAAAGTTVLFAAPQNAWAQQSSPRPTVQFDLRVHGTDAKEITVYKTGEAVQLDLYATTYGFDDDPSNDRISAGSGYVQSSTGGLLGNLLGLQSPSPFNQSGSQNGTPRDFDSDGDLDLGTAADPALNDFYGFRSFPAPDSQPPEGLFVGRMRFTVGTIAEANTQLQFLVRGYTGSLGGVLTWSDGATIGPTPDPIITYGAPVTIHGSLQNDSGPITLQSGAVNTHATISTHIRATTGGTLTYNTGLDAVPGGLLDAPAGTVRLNVNDATSGNAGGALYLNGITIGTTADGTFTQSAGLTRSAVTVSGAGGVSGTFNISGGTFVGNITAGRADPGDGKGDGVGYVHQTGGNSTVSQLRIRAGSTVDAGGGSFYVTGNAYVGDYGTGTLIQSGGQGDVGGTLNIGFAAFETPGSGSLLVQGGVLRASTTNVGDEGTGAMGQVRQTGGTFLPGKMTLSSPDPATPSTYHMEQGQLQLGLLNLNNNGFIVQSGGDVSVQTPVLNISNKGSTVTSQYIISGGTVGGYGLLVSHTNPAGVSLSGGRRGGLAQTGGSVNFKEIVIDPTGTYDLHGGSLSATYRLIVNGKLDFGDGNATLNLLNKCFADFTHGQVLNATHASFIGGAGSVMEFAAGFDPFTQIGSIQTQGIVHVAGQPLVIPSGKGLGGSGTITGDVTNEGSIAPGNSPGSIAIAGNFTQGHSATLDMEIASAASGGFDTLTITGTATLDGTLDLDLLDGFVPKPSDQFLILSASNVSGTFANAPGQVNLAGGRFDLIYSSTGVTLTNFQSVPEPAAVALFMTIIGAGSVLLRRVRRDSES